MPSPSTLSATGIGQCRLPNGALDVRPVRADHVVRPVDHELGGIDVVGVPGLGIGLLPLGIGLGAEGVRPADIVPVVDMVGEPDDIGPVGDVAEQRIGRRTGRAALAGEQLEHRLGVGLDLGSGRRRGDSGHQQRGKKSWRFHGPEFLAAAPHNCQSLRCDFQVISTGRSDGRGGPPARPTPARDTARTTPRRGCAARSAGCRRGGSSRPRRAYRCGRAPAPCPCVPFGRWITSDRSIRGVRLVQAGDVDHLLAGEAERLAVHAFLEGQRQHAHADQVGAVDALEALDDHRLARRAAACPSPPSRATSRCRIPCRRRSPAARPRPCSASPRRRSASARRTAGAWSCRLRRRAPSRCGCGCWRRCRAS